MAGTGRAVRRPARARPERPQPGHDRRPAGARPHQEADMPVTTLDRPPVSAAARMLLDRSRAPGCSRPARPAAAASATSRRTWRRCGPAAAVLAVRGRPSDPGRSAQRLGDAAPGRSRATEWAAFFAATASRRAAVEAGRGEVDPAPVTPTTCCATPRPSTTWWRRSLGLPTSRCCRARCPPAAEPPSSAVVRSSVVAHCRPQPDGRTLHPPPRRLRLLAALRRLDARGAGRGGRRARACRRSPSPTGTVCTAR